MNKLRTFLGKHLRYLADRIDREHAFVMFTVATAKLKEGHGLIMDKTQGGRVDGKQSGLKLWYMNHEHDKLWDGYPNNSDSNKELKN